VHQENQHYKRENPYSFKEIALQTSFLDVIGVEALSRRITGISKCRPDSCMNFDLAVLKLRLYSEKE